MAIQLAKAWKAHVTACVSPRVGPLAKLLGADRVITLSLDERTEEALSDDYFDFCLMTCEDSLISETFCCEISNTVLKSYTPRRIPSDGYGFFRRWLLSYWRAIWPSEYQLLNVQPLNHLKQLVEAGKLQPVLDSG